MKPVKHPHGTSNRYTHGPAGDGADPCRCSLCRTAHNARKAAYNRRRAYGRVDMVDAAPVRAHVEALRAAGMGRRRIAAKAGVGEATVQRLCLGRRGRLPQRTTGPVARALLAVRADLTDLAPLTPVDGTGTRRRLRALVAAGWSPVLIAARLEVSHKRCHQLLRGTGRVSARHALAVRALCDQLWCRTPPAATGHQRRAVTKARNLAAREGWVPIAAWDDHQVDDPAARPVEVPRRPPGGVRKVLPEDVVHLRRFGVNNQQIAERLRVDVEAVRRAGLLAGQQNHEPDLESEAS